MGEPKALLRWGTVTLLQHQVDALRSAGCDPIVVVLGHEAERLRAGLECRPPCRIVVNGAYQEGRASSVRTGMAAAPDGARAVVVASVDQPCRATTVRALISAQSERGAPIAVPERNGQRGHPAVFAGALLPELRRVQEQTQGLKAVRRAHADETIFVASDDPWVTLDLNTREDYAAARTAEADAREVI